MAVLRDARRATRDGWLFCETSARFIGISATSKTMAALLQSVRESGASLSDTERDAGVTPRWTGACEPLSLAAVNGVTSERCQLRDLAGARFGETSGGRATVRATPPATIRNRAAVTARAGGRRRRVASGFDRLSLRHHGRTRRAVSLPPTGASGERAPRANL
jgi:hypothetical protein